MNRSIAIVFVFFALASSMQAANDTPKIFAQISSLGGKLNNVTRSKKEPKEQAQEVDFEKLKVEPIGGKPGEEIKQYMQREALKMKKINGAIVSTMRNGEILKVSIPSEQLFLPNETTLIQTQAETTLGPILVLMRHKKTDLVITGHSDNTGSQKYTQRISQERADAVDKWLQKKGIEQNHLSVHAYGDQQPLFENDSMENRARNRRVTFYFIPNQEMLKAAKRKKLNK